MKLLGVLELPWWGNWLVWFVFIVSLLYLPSAVFKMARAEGQFKMTNQFAVGNQIYDRRLPLLPPSNEDGRRYSKYKQSCFWRLGIPGPKPTAFLGLLPEMKDKGITEVDRDLLKKYGRVVGTFFGNWPQLLVADAEMIKQICVKEFSNFENRPSLVKSRKPFSGGMSMATGDHWRFLRATISPTFTSGKMKGMKPLVADCVASLVKNLGEKATKESVDMKELFGSYVIDTICTTAFGIKADSLNNADDPFVANAKKAMQFSFKDPFFLFVIFFPDLKPVFHHIPYSVLKRDVVDFFVSVANSSIAERRKESSNHKDFVQIMVDAQKEFSRGDTSSCQTYEGYKARGITDDEILANALIFLLVGYDTTGNAMTWMSYLLATHQEVQERLIQEIDDNVEKRDPDYDTVMKLTYLDMVLNETLRLYPTATRIQRECKADVDICGQKIPKGMDVEIPVYALHHDPEYWPDPERFDPERFSAENKGNINQYAYLPFGIGPRNCVGMRLAFLQMKLAVVSILQKYRFITTPKTQIPAEISKTGLVGPANGMWLQVERRYG